MEALSFCDWVKEENLIWLSSVNQNALIQYDLNKKEGKTIAYFINESPGQMCLHKQIIRWKSSLFFFPELGKSITKYDLETGEMRAIPIHLETVSREGQTKIAGVAQREHMVWIFPQYISQPLLVLNMDTGDLETRLDWNRKIRHSINEKERPFAMNAEFDGQKVWIPLRGTAHIVEVDLPALTNRIHTIPSEQAQNHMLSKIGDDLWITQLCGPQVIRISTAGNMTVYRAEEISEDGWMPFSKVVRHNDSFWLLPSWANHLGKISGQGKDIELIDLPQEKIRMDKKEKKGWPRYQNYYRENGSLCIFPIRSNYLLTIDQQDRIQFHQICADMGINQKLKMEYLLKSGFSGGWVKENKSAGLEEYLAYCKANRKTAAAAPPAARDGQRIFMELMKEF